MIHFDSPHESKADATNLIKWFFKFVKTQFDKQIKVIRTGNAKELALHNFLQTEGTIHQLSCPHKPTTKFCGREKASIPIK